MKVIINGERTKKISGFNRYRISESGRIYRVVPVNNKEKLLLKENPNITYFHESHPKIQKYKGRHDHMAVGLCKNNGKLTCRGLANLVMETFGKAPLKKNLYYYKIKYLDGNPENCHIKNIEYVKRQSRNMILKQEDIPIIREMIDNGKTLRSIAKQFGVCEMQINRIKTGENWNEKGRVIFPKKLPFDIEDVSIRKIMRNFESSKMYSGNHTSYFMVNRNPKNGKDNKIIGRIKGYRFARKCENITDARMVVYRLNKYFFSQEIANKVDDKIIKNINPPVGNKKKAEINDGDYIELSGMRIYLI